jgi:tricorn protease-like protein
VIPQSSSGSPQICLDALSLDYHFVADHCAQGAITIRDLQTGSTASVQVPSDFTGYRFIGSARFSPAGNQVAFALAKGDPNDEQGWLAIGNSTGGTAKIIVTGDTGSYYNVIGWVDDQTLLVQQISVSGANATNQVFTVKSDGSVISKVAEGILLSVIDNR